MFPRKLFWDVTVNLESRELQKVASCELARLSRGTRLPITEYQYSDLGVQKEERQSLKEMTGIHRNSQELTGIDRNCEMFSLLVN